jgi:(p)ppGpp synthase/HD superfamily hydrolase
MGDDEKTLDYWIGFMQGIAEENHKGATRNDGITPYMTHVQGVADKVEKRLKPIALGHDLVEDTSVTIQDLIDYGFPSYITDAIHLLTHHKSDPNILYWNRILTNTDAVRVKLADIDYNINDSPSARQREKYEKALQLFADAGYKL